MFKVRIVDRIQFNGSSDWICIGFEEETRFCFNIFQFWGGGVGHPWKVSNFESEERQAIMFCRCGCAGNRKVTTVCPIPHYNAMEDLVELLEDESKKKKLEDL